MKSHTDALVARIRSIPALATKTFVAVAPRDPTTNKLPVAPFVVVYPAEGTDTRERFTGPAVTQHPSFTLHIVGSSYDNAATVAALIKAKFVVSGVAVQMSVPGEKSMHLYYSSPQPIEVDNDLTPPLIYAVAEIGWRADPA